MNINNPSQDDIVEVATIAGAGLLLAGTGLSVYTGVLEVPLAAEIVAVGLAALGLHEGGRRRGKKSALIKWGLGELDDLGEKQGAQSPSQTSQTGTPASHSSAESEKSQQSATDSRPVTLIGGIGTERSGVLSAAGIETLDDLASVNVQLLADETGLSATRIERWQKEARNR